MGAACNLQRCSATAALCLALCGVWAWQILTGSMPAYRGGWDVPGALAATFCHGSWLHLLANVAALWWFRPRWGTVAVGMAVGVAGMMACCHGAPVCGASGVVFACYGRRGAWDQGLHWTVLWCNALMAPWGTVAVELHLVCYAAGVAVWRVVNKKR